jgi:hypothetical protein
MKSIRRFLSAALLTFVFAAAAFADDGIIHSDAPAPTDGIIHSDAPASATAPDDGIIHSDAPAANATDAIITTVLTVIGNVLAI